MLLYRRETNFLFRLKLDYFSITTNTALSYEKKTLKLENDPLLCKLYNFSLIRKREEKNVLTRFDNTILGKFQTFGL